jgi:hypothetical protein
MRKSELIKKLQAIDGDPLVFVDINGEHSDDMDPHVFTTNPVFLKNINSHVKTLPAHGEKVILI